MPMPNSSQAWYYAEHNGAEYADAGTASDNKQYVTGFYGTGRRCDQCEEDCVLETDHMQKAIYKHSRCVVNATMGIYGDCFPSSDAAIEDCVGREPGTQPMPLPTFTTDTLRFGVREMPRDVRAWNASQCAFYADQTAIDGVITSSKGLRYCDYENIGLAAMPPGLSSTHKYSITCRVMKYFNCVADSPASTSSSCINQKHSECQRVCRVANELSTTDGGCDITSTEINGCMPDLSTCDSTCTMDGLTPQFFCSRLVAGL
jgi:hypothetical protein